MTVLSTPRLSNEEALPTMFALWAPVYGEAQKRDMKDFDSPSVTTTGSMPPTALPSVGFVPCPLRLAHSPDIEHKNIGGNDHGAPQRHHVFAPVDDGSQWYCSECQDGPYGSWQVSCQNCSHSKCSLCSNEKKK